jgi:uncharacterized protein YprB with RNaseH-like and TPR domain
MFDAYLDIETTGLTSSFNRITVVGIYLHKNQDSEERLIQLVGNEITDANILFALVDAREIFTYNGSRFDLPFIRDRVGVDLADIFKHTDLMYDCWKRNLRGGFKAVERQLGIPRKLKNIQGIDAVRLWYRYREREDIEALNVLLEYNKEDVMNLKVLRDRLT